MTNIASLHPHTSYECYVLISMTFITPLRAKLTWQDAEVHSTAKTCTEMTMPGEADVLAWWKKKLNTYIEHTAVY